MKPKDRVACAFAHREPDRVPIDYDANSEIDLRLKAHFGLEPEDNEGLRQRIGVDFRRTFGLMFRDDLYSVEPGTRVNEWGAPMRWVEHSAGGYWDYAGWPLQQATLDEVEAWPMPTVHDFSFDHIRSQCQQWRDYFMIVGGPGVGDIINQTGMLRTMEQVLLDLMTDEPAGLRLIDRRLEVELQVLEQAIRAADGGVDMVMIGEDLGTQRAPLLSIDLFRKHIRPRLQPFIDLARRYDLPVMMHSDGSVDWVYPDLIDMGVSVVDAVQIECAGMEPASLKGRFGDRLSFHGVWPTTGVLAHGTAEQAVDEVRHLLEVMKPGGGFAMAPAHCLQSNTPVDNVVLSYEAIHTFGRYR